MVDQRDGVRYGWQVDLEKARFISRMVDIHDLIDSQSVKTTEKWGSAALTRTSRPKAANATSSSTRS
jgi:hypothetical protein